ncbi:cytochrome P450 2F3-like [Anableps anableps]
MFVSLFLLGLCVIFLFLQLKPRRPKNFPPGPPSLPLLGNLLHLNLENPLKDFERLRESYGNVYSLFIGAKPAVVINGFKAMKEAIVIKSTDFAGRPQDLFINDVTQRKGVVMTDYGPMWREHRRFALMTLKNFGLGKKSMEDRILEEIQHTIKTLEKNSGNTLSPQVMFHNAASNIICQILFGTRYEYDDETIKLIVRCFAEMTKIANGPWAMLYDSIPLIRHLPLPFNKASEDMETPPPTPSLLGFFTSAVIHEIQRIANTVPLSAFHCTTKDTDLMGYTIPKGTMVIQNLNSVLREEGQWKFPHEFNPENFLNGQGEFVKPEAFMPFSAGPRMCLGEGLARMELFLIMVTLLRRFKFIWPEEAGEPDFTPVFGVTLTPKPCTMKAVIHETQRIANTVPLSVFHCTTKDTELMGYSIPQGTMIIQNLASVLREEGQWKFPHELNPENFLNEQGEFAQFDLVQTNMISLLLLGLCVCFLLFQLKPQRPKNFPPGPPSLPVLGNLCNLNLKNPLEDFERLRQSYGNIYSLFLGLKPVVVLNKFKAMKEAMVIKAADFAGRPQNILITDITKSKGVILVDYGSLWRDHRRFALTTLRNFGLGKKSMEERIHEEIQYTIKTLENNIGKTLSPQFMFHNAASNIICKVLFGTRYEYHDETIKIIVRCFTEIIKIANGPWAMLYDSIPLIRPLPLPFNKAFKNMETFLSISRRLVNEHKKNRVQGEPRDFVDCYLDELEKRDDDSTFSEEQLIRITFDLYAAGTDTTSNTLLTGFLYLMNYPHIQERCQQEIDQVLEGQDQVTFEDRHNMPYMQAVIHETQRIANTVPLSVFHCTTKDTELMGYSIPQGTMIIQNLASVLKEEGQWKFPHEFNPENFLNEQGEFVKPEAFMPFSAGSRICLGEGLARMELFLIMVTLMRKFKFIWPEDAGEPDFTPVFGATLTPKPYFMKIQLRADQ